MENAHYNAFRFCENNETQLAQSFVCTILQILRKHYACMGKHLSHNAAEKSLIENWRISPYGLVESKQAKKKKNGSGGLNFTFVIYPQMFLRCQIHQQLVAQSTRLRGRRTQRLHQEQYRSRFVQTPPNDKRLPDGIWEAEECCCCLSLLEPFLLPLCWN